MDAVNAAIYSIWDTHDPEHLVKKAAAQFLLSNTAFTATSVRVAAAVSQAVGTVSSLGISKRFEELIDEDPCFQLDKNHINARITLNTSQVVFQHQWKQDEQQQMQLEQQQWQQPQPKQDVLQHAQPQEAAAAAASVSKADSDGGSSSSSTCFINITPKLLKGMNELWPLKGRGATAETQVKHKALYHLLLIPHHSCSRSQLAHAVKGVLGSVKDLGCHKSFAQVLQEDTDIFVVACVGSEGTVKLNVQGVLNKFVRRRSNAAAQTAPQQQQQQQHTQQVLQQPDLSAVLQHRLELSRQQQGAQGQQQAQPALAGLAAVLQQRLQQPQLQQPPEQHPAALPGTVPARQLLLYVRSRQWHTDTAVDAARRALVEYLVLKANPAADDQPAITEAKRYTMLEARAGHIITAAVDVLGAGAQHCCPDLKQVVDQDPYLNMYPVGGVYHVKLDVQQLLQDAAAAPRDASTPAQQQNSATASSSTSSSLAATFAALTGGVAAGQVAGEAAAAGFSSAVQAVALPAAGSSSNAGQVSAAALLQHVRSRVWHKDNPQLDLARRAVAVLLVTAANGGGDGSDRPANSSPEAYVADFAQAGHASIKALRLRYGDTFQPSYRKTSQVFEGDTYWTTFQSHATQYSVRLDILRLLHEAASSGSILTTNSTASSGRSIGAAADSVQVATKLARPASAASSGAASSKPPVAAVSPAAAGGGSGAAAAEAAAAAVRAAAKSLMPPAVKSPAVQSAATAGNLPPGLPASSNSTSTSPAAPTAAGQGQPPLSPAGAGPPAPRPFIPPWLLLGRATAAAAAHWAGTDTQPQPLQQQQLSVSSSGATQQLVCTAGVPNGSAVVAGGLTLQQPQEQQARGTRAAATPATAGLAAEVDAEAVQLRYELQLCNTAPGWYVANYLLPNSADMSSSSSSSGGSGRAAADSTPATRADSPGHSTAPTGASPASSDGSTGMAAVQAEVAAAAAKAKGEQGADDQAAAQDSADATAAEGSIVVEAAAAGAGQPFNPHAGTTEAAAPAGAEAEADADAEAAAAVDVAPSESAVGAAESSEHVGRAAAPSAAGGACADAGLDASGDLQALLKALPEMLAAALQPYLFCPSPSRQPQLTHILIDRGQPVTLRFSDRTCLTLTSPHVTLEEALQQLVDAAQQWTQQENGDSLEEQQQQHAAVTEQQNGVGVRSRCIGAGESLEKDAVYLHSHAPECDQATTKTCSLGTATVPPAAQLSRGRLLSVQAAARALFSSSSSSSSWCLGVPGSCHRVCAVPGAAGDITGLTYCLQHHVPGAAAGLADVLSTMKASLTLDSGYNRPVSLLVVGRPGVGKTGLLRDVCRLMSSAPELGGLGLHVMLLDTTAQLAGLTPTPTPHLGSTRRLWVPDPAQQSTLMLQAALHHAPDVLVVDELSTAQDVAAAVHISRSHNLLLVAGAAANSLTGLLQDRTLSPLVGCEQVAVSTNTTWSSSSSQSNLEAVRPPPFAVLLEMVSRSKWRMHPDLPNSISTLQASAAPGSKDSFGIQHPCLSTELRSRSSDGRLLVYFSSARAARTALADAAVLQAVVDAATATCSRS